MKTAFLELSLENGYYNEQLFLKDPSSDFYLICGKRLFPLHKRFLVGVSKLMEKIIEDHRIYELQTDIQEDIIEDILAVFYGKKILIERSDKIIHYLEAVQLFEAQDSLIEIFLSDFQNNFDQYSVFTLLLISKNFDLENLQDHCISELINNGFEQLNYNKYELFKCDLDLFKFIIKEHEHHRQLGRFSGISNRNIQALIEQFCYVNSVKIDPSQLMKQLLWKKSFSYINELYSILLSSDKIYSCGSSGRSSFPSRNSEYSENISLSRSSSCSSNKQSSKKNKIEKIKKQNEDMNKKSLELSGQLSEISKNLSSEAQTDHNEEITLSLNKFQLQSQTQNSKILDLQNKFTTLLKTNSQQAPQKSQWAPTTISSPLKSMNLLEIPTKESMRSRRKSAQTIMQLQIPVLENSNDFQFF